MSAQPPKRDENPATALDAASTPFDAGPQDDIARKARLDFLLAMYKALWDNINRHVQVLWQSAAVLATAFGAALLLKKDGGAAAEGSTTDIAAAVVIAAACWLFVHAVDAANWINRNLQIIGNVEAQFLGRADRAVIHPYIGFKRPNKMLPHTKIQASLAVLVGMFAFIAHFVSRVVPTLDADAAIDWARFLPTITVVVGASLDIWAYKSARSDFARFLEDMKAGKIGF
jgi:hypothetical protein